MNGKQTSSLCAYGGHRRCTGVCHYGNHFAPCLCECHVQAGAMPEPVRHLYASHELSALEANRRMVEAFRLGQNEEGRTAQ